MSKELIFEGHSDDIFIAADDEYYDFAVVVTGGNGSLVVRAFYGDGKHNKGVWCIGVEPVDEDTPIPDWPMKFESAKNGYSPKFIITAPDDTIVEKAT